jgi:phytoene dehydrogenase-like protein
VTIAGEERRQLSLKHYCYDPSLAPAGKSVATVMLLSNYDYWKKVAEDPEEYEVEKKQVALTVIEQLDRRVPGLGEQVEVADVATPLTYERYTGNWRGSMEGWLITTKTMKMVMLGKGMSKTLPGLENFYMIGQWVEPGGGVPTAAMSARNVLQIICHRDKRPFATSIPS